MVSYGSVANLSHLYPRNKTRLVGITKPIRKT